MNESLIGVGTIESGNKEVGNSESRPTLYDCKGERMGYSVMGKEGSGKGCFILRWEK